MGSIPPARAPRPTVAPLRRIALAGVAMFGVLVVLLSCMGGEPTAPKEGIRYAAGLRFNTIFPSGYSASRFAGVVTFDRVHILLTRRVDGSVALDTIINFPSNVDSISLDLNVRLSPGATSTGEDLMVSLDYLTATNETVFKGQKQITATPDLPGAPAQDPVVVPVVYTGPGSSATGVKISPRQVAVNGGAPFAFTAVGVDASGATVANTPIAWASLDPARASITAPSAGNGVALNQRGAARIVASLVGGQADTVIVNVSLPPSAIAAVSGTGQSGAAGKPRALPQPLVVKVTSADGVGAGGVTVSFAAVTGGGSVSPATAVTDNNGQAQTNWTLGSALGPQTAAATATNLTGSPVTFTATANTAVATKLAFTTSPLVGAAMSANVPFALAVTAQDVDGDPVSSYTGTVSLSIGAGPAGATMGGTTTATAVGGVANFTGVTLALVGAGYTIKADAQGLTGASSSTFSVATGPATIMALASGAGQTAAVNTALSPIVVVVTDAAGNPRAGTTINFAVTTGGGSVTPASVNTDSAGRASGTWTLGAAGGVQTLTVSSTGLPSIVVSATATNAQNQIVFTQQPTAAQTAGVAFTPALVAEVRDQAGALLSTYTGAVTIAIGTNPGSATLSGVTTVNAVAGVATFANNSLNKSGTGYTIVASTAGASNGTSTAFNVGPAAAAALVLQSGGGQSGQPSTALAAPIVARVNDAFGNAVQGVSVSFAISAGGGSVTPASSQTNALGQASTAWTLGAQGVQTLSITSAGLTGSPLSATATFGAGPAATTTVSPQLDTITAFTDTRQLSAQARDLGGNIVGGTWTWTSRTPTVATVSATGVVTSVANGSAYIVATEALGSKDSALIVVQQRIATVNVTPAARSIYTGGLFTFTAQAVDGRGVAMVTQPTFTWSSQVPSVATVNSTTGVATGITIGSTQIRATTGNTVGVSNLTVLTPITRIDVSYDSTNAPAPDVFTMTSLGDRRLYKAVARDTLLNVMTGITFTWNSTNASVALIDSTTPVKARATAAANGVTSIQASAQGVTGAATLNVAQVLNSIDLTPLTATVAVSGSTPMVARGKDANGRYISGGTFTYVSSTPSVATVNASTGVVTGVTNGQSTITATSGNIISNSATVFVNGSGPAVISFGRDTLGIGRGTSLQFPILLSKPSATPVVVNLAVADTFAFWSTASVTIPANATSTNATLNGRNAGTTKVYAIDGGNTAYAGDTAVLTVQANLRMTTTSYSLVANDQIVTQALLSDPSPAGGTYVTFTYGTAGKALVSPDPAFIPAGQLAADVVIKGLAAGSTTLIPSAAGVTGNQAFINVGPATLVFQQSAFRLGEGQFDPNSYVTAPNNLFSPLAVTLTSLDTTLLRVPPTTTIPANSYYSYFTYNAVGRGTGKIVSSATGWTPDTMSVIVTTPKVTICCNNNFNTTSQPQTFSVSSADSVRTQHPRTNSLVVRVSSSDTTVVKVIDTLVTIPAGSSNKSGQVVPGGVGGTAWVYSTASGHTPDSVRYTVVGPALALSFNTLRLGAGQEEGENFNYYVQIPNPTGTGVVVTLTSSDSSIAATAQTVVIGANGTTQYLTLRGKSPGTATIIASAPGYSPDTATINVTTPRLLISGGSQVNQFSTTSTTVYAADSVNNVHFRTTPLTVRFSSSDTTILTVDTVVTITAGSRQANPLIRGLSPGTVQIIATAPGHVPDTATWTVLPAKLNMSWVNFYIGAHQQRPAQDVYVQTPASRTVAVPVTFTQKQQGRVAVSPSLTVTIPANSNIAYFSLAGLATGRDTIIATAPGYLPDTGFVIVTTPKLRQTGLPSSATTTSPPVTMTVYPADSLSTIHYASDTVVVHAVSSDTGVIQVGQPYYRILKGSNFTNPVVTYIGVGTANITFTDSLGFYLPVTTNNVTVTGPSLAFSTSTGTLGMRQQSSQFEYYLYRPNASATPLTVNLVSTDPRVATVPATVTIPANGTGVYFPITAQDTIGTIQIQATATGFGLATMSMRVAHPMFTFSISSQLNTTSPAQTITVYARDEFGTTHNVAQDVIVNLASSAPGVVSIDSNFVTIPAGQNYSQGAKMRPGAVGTAVLTASDSRTAYYKYLPGTTSVSVITPQANLSFSTVSLGVGQYDDNEYLQVPDAVTSAMTVPLGHAAVPHTNTPASVVIPVNQSYIYFRISGTSLGFDTITVSPPGHTPDKGEVRVTLGRIDPLSGWPSSLRAGDSVLVTLYTRDINQNVRNVLAATTFTLAPNANVQFVSGGANSTVITSATVPADGQYVQFYMKGVAPGNGSANITSTNYTPYFNTVTVTP